MSLAETKRRIVIGTQLKLVRHDWFTGGGMTVHGNLGTTVLKGRIEVGCIRTVSRVQTAQFALATPQPDGSVKDSWVQWPKASSFRVTANGFEIDLKHTGTFEEAMGYEFVNG